jgi:hypothetical protein
MHASWHRIAIAALFACACDPVEDGHRPLDDILPVPDDVPDPLGAPTPGVITPVLLVPTDRAVDQRHVDAVNAGLADLRAWYERETGSHRLEMEGLRVVYGSRDAAGYRENDGIWNDGPNELRGLLGFSPWDEGHMVLLIGAGLRGWAGGNTNATASAGFAVLGLESLTDQSDCEPGAQQQPGWCTPEVWRGTAIHELGHALSLPHSEAPSIMHDHYAYLDRHLLETNDFPERNTIRTHLFARPLDGGGGDGGGGDGGGDPSGGGGDPSGGEPPPNNDWSPCTDDLECTSGWCGCDWGTDRVCLPSTDYAKDCVGWKGEWEPCGSDGECMSLWCGCNYGTDMVCLPSSDYPKDCVAPPKGDWEPCAQDSDCMTNWCGCNFGSEMVCLPTIEYPKDCV